MVSVTTERGYNLTAICQSTTRPYLHVLPRRQLVTVVFVTHQMPTMSVESDDEFGDSLELGAPEDVKLTIT